MIITICNSFVLGTAMRIFTKQKCRRFTSAGISFCERTYHDRGFIRKSAGKVSGIRFRFSRMVSIAIGVHEETNDKQLSWKLRSTSFLPSNEIYFSATSTEKFLSVWIQICVLSLIQIILFYRIIKTIEILELFFYFIFFLLLCLFWLLLLYYVCFDYCKSNNSD